MRRRISLYIDEKLADLSDESFVLFNYAADDVANPAAIQNSFSQQITLPGTPRNDAIFGHAYRADRVPLASPTSHSGIHFAPILRTPFALFLDTGEVLESGYLKLDRVDRKGAAVSYVCTLYGGLGSFLYGLSYDAQGEKRTLAGLDYLKTGNPDTELDFTINATTVQNAWLALSPPSGIWAVVNFAPCYNGYPDGEFDADKGLFDPSKCNLPISKDGASTAYTAGFALATLPRQFSEWEVKDLRSYLQRPVVNVKKVLEAIADPDNNGGWTVAMPALTDASYEWEKLWMTLPLLPSLGGFKQTTGALSASLVVTTTTGPTIGEFAIGGADSLPVGTAVKADVNVKLRIPDDGYLSNPLTQELYNDYHSVAFVQAVAVDSYANDIGASQVILLRSSGPFQFASVQDAAQKLVFNDAVNSNNVWDGEQLYGVWEESGGWYVYANDLSFHLDLPDGSDLQSIQIRMYAYKYEDLVSHINNGTGGLDACITLLDDNDGTEITPTSMQLTAGSGANSLVYVTPETLRSGAQVNKQLLLAGTCSPAEFLTSFCKTFGLYLVCNTASKTVTVSNRGQFYDGAADVIDLTKRIDLASGVTIEPCGFDTRWWDFRHASVGGAFQAEYAQIIGREYGIQRVNTGWDFNAEVKDVMQGVVFKGAASVLESSPCFYAFTDSPDVYPTPFVYAGGKYSLWDANGETVELDIPAMPDSVVMNAAPINEYGHPGYDSEWAWKIQLHDKDGKPVDGAGVLVLFNGYDGYDGFHLTDDLPVMNIVNNGTPCWLLDYNPNNQPAIPAFTRYEPKSMGWKILKSLDFGLPAELDIPAIDYEANVTIYAKRWGNYLRDRLSAATKVMRCKADLRGLQVGQPLLGRFWWYDGAIWVLNKITNHSLTTWDLTECEFVQVQDKDNYTNGQN